MRLCVAVVAVLATICGPQSIDADSQRLQHSQALFVNRDAIESGAEIVAAASRRVKRQSGGGGSSASADQMVQNILQWLQGVYTQNSRRIRQGTLREYLPPTNTQRPRPFQPPGGGLEPGEKESESEQSNYIGYPPTGVTPKPEFPLPPSVRPGYPSPPPDITPPISNPDYSNGGYPKEPQPHPNFPTPETTTPGGYQPKDTPGPTTGYPITGYPTEGSSSYPSPSTTYTPSTLRTFPTGPPPGYPAPGPGPITTRPFPSGPPPGYPGPSTPRPFPTAPPPSYTTPTTTEAPTTSPSVHYPDHSETDEEPSYTSQPITAHQTTPTPLDAHTDAPDEPEDNTIAPEDDKHQGQPDEQTPDVKEPPVVVVKDDSEDDDTEDKDKDDLTHPPHIHAIEVECAKDMMTIKIEFNRQFDGVIYSKGFYQDAECRYVKANTAQTKYEFTVSLNSCGTEFISAFETQGESYLENVLVLQNEVGIQEVWDTIRAVRCLWQGNLNKSLSVALSVGMLNQELVTFSGDTAMASLDIQLGRGPFAPPANGLVKIGEPMTLVVSVRGDPGFDIQVKDCIAKDSSGDNTVALTDANGCVLKPKLFGAFQKTRSTGDTGASIIAYAFFSAFKFPDLMDLMIECNVELCKTDCEACPDPNPKIEPGRRRRRDLSLPSSPHQPTNSSLGDPITMGKHIRVILPEDLMSDADLLDLTSTTQELSTSADRVCVTVRALAVATCSLMGLLCASCVITAYLWLKNQRLSRSKM